MITSSGLRRLPRRLVRYGWHRSSAPLRWLRRRPARTALGHHLSTATEAPALAGELADEVAIIMSHKLESADRLAMLAVSIRQLVDGLAGVRIKVIVVDSSTGLLGTEARRLWMESGLDVEFESLAMPLGPAYVRMLEALEQPHVYIQFDDMVTAGLSPDFLRDSCSFLDRHAGHVDVVGVPWCLSAVPRRSDRVIEVVAQRRRQSGEYLFRPGGWQAPLAVERLLGGPFGIFQNFDYGFFLHNLVAPRDDFCERLRWYLEHVSWTSVHAIEMAARNQLRGPTWPHVGVSLAGVALVDLDFAHTTAAVRPESPQLRERVEMLNAGWAFDVHVEDA